MAHQNFPLEPSTDRGYTVDERRTFANPGWVILLLAPAGSMVERLGLLPWFAVTLGIFLGGLCIMWKLDASRRRRLRHLLAARIRQRSGHEPEPSLPLVGLSFGVPNVEYAGSPHWDIGFLSSGPHGLAYYGDDISFQIPISEPLSPLGERGRGEGKDSLTLTEATLVRTDLLSGSWAVQLVWQDWEGTDRKLILVPNETVSPFARARECQRIVTAIRFGTLPTRLPAPLGLPPTATATGLVQRPSLPSSPAAL